MIKCENCGLYITPIETMERFTFTKDNFVSLGRGLLMALAGAVMTYLSTYVAGHDFGSWTPVITFAWSTLANAARLYVKNG